MNASARNRRRQRGGVDIWPGFVDALSTLLLVIIFLLSVFVLAQFFLGQALTGRDQALVKLRDQVSELGNLLALEREANADLRQTVAQISASLQAANLNREDLTAKLRDMETKLADAEAHAQQSAGADLGGRYQEAQQELAAERERTQAAKKEVDLLNAQLAAVRQQLAALGAVLEASEKRDQEQQAQIVNLGKRLNAALAAKVEELAQYRSEFFGRLKEVLGEREDIRIEGDRFVFQSEVLFATASDEIGPEGRAQISKLAQSLNEVAARIPPQIHWILLVEGHTDVRPIKGGPFASNWELSTARALSVVHLLQADGIAPERLAAAGYGPFHPIDPAATEDAFRRNRRIEFKLTSR